MDKAPSKRSQERRLKLTALGVLLLGLWGMLALLLGASVGMESNRRRTQHPGLEPGFGETHATRHRNAGISAPESLPPLCLGRDCPGMEQVASGPHHDDAPGDEVDDATSAIGRPSGPQTPPPTFTPGGSSDPVPNWLFIPPGPTGGGNPNGPDSGNPVPGGPNTDNPPQKPNEKPNDMPPPDLTQPPFFDPPGPNGPGGPDAPNGPNSPGGPDGPAGPDGPPHDQPPSDPPQQLPEPLTFPLFAGGLAASIWLRRRRDRAPK